MKANHNNKKPYKTHKNKKTNKKHTKHTNKQKRQQIKLNNQEQINETKCLTKKN